MRAYQLIRGLSKRHTVHLVAFSASDDDLRYVDVLQSFCEQAHVAHDRRTAIRSLKGAVGLLSPAPRSYVAAWNPEVKVLVDRLVDGGGYDAAIAFGLRNGPYLRSCRGIARIIDNDNCDTEYIARSAAQLTSRLLRFRRKLTWAKSRRYEARLAPRFDAALVVSQEDASALGGIAPALAARGAIHVIPNGADLVLLDYRGPEVDCRQIIFTGALTYSANLDAAVYFVREVFPAIKSRIADAHLVITGSVEGVDVSLFRNRPDVRLTGRLEDVRPEIARSGVVVVPTRVGGGTRLKVLEAMALGTPVVATSFGAMGLGVEHGHNILIGDTPGEFAEQVCRLIESSELRAVMAANGREFVRERYGWDGIVDRLDRVIETTVESVRGGEECRIA